MFKKSKKKLVSEQEVSETTENIQITNESNGIKKTPAKTLLDIDDLYIVCFFVALEVFHHKYIFI